MFRNSNRILAPCDAGGGSPPPHHEQTLALPNGVEHGSLTTPWEKLIKIGAMVVSHGRNVEFPMAETAIPRSLFANIPRLIDVLRPAPLPP